MMHLASPKSSSLSFFKPLLSVMTASFQTPNLLFFASFSAALTKLMSVKLYTFGFLFPPVKDLEYPSLRTTSAKFCFLSKTVTSQIKFLFSSKSNIVNFTSLQRHIRSQYAFPFLYNSGSFELLGIDTNLKLTLAKQFHFGIYTEINAQLKTCSTIASISVPLLMVSSTFFLSSPESDKLHKVLTCFLLSELSPCIPILFSFASLSAAWSKGHKSDL